MQDGYSNENKYGTPVPKNKEAAHNSSKPIADGMKIMPPMKEVNFKPASQMADFKPRD